MKTYFKVININKRARMFSKPHYNSYYKKGRGSALNLGAGEGNRTLL